MNTENADKLVILYRAWVIADANFTHALVKTYGKTRAINARYWLTHASLAVREAKRDFIRAGDAYKCELDRQRNYSA